MALRDVDLPGLLRVEAEEVEAARPEASAARVTATASPLLSTRVHIAVQKTGYYLLRLVTAEAAAGGQGPEPPGDPGPVHQDSLVTRGRAEVTKEEEK